jgi:hypothetical protein
MRKRRNERRSAGLRPGRPGSRPFGRACPRSLARRARTIWLRQRSPNAASAKEPRSRWQARAYGPEKPNLPLARLFHERYRWALYNPRAVTEQCSFSSFAPFAMRRSFRSVVRRGFAGTPAAGLLSGAESSQGDGGQEVADFAAALIG